MTIRNPTGEAIPSAPFGDAVVAAMLAQLPGMVWAVDADLDCRYASPAASLRLGLRAGASITAVPAAGLDAALLLRLHRSALSGAPVRGDLRVGDASLSLRFEPLRGAGGEALGVLGSAVDTTERDRAARLVETQLAVFAATLEHAPEGIVVCDATGRFLYANAASRRLAEREAEGTPIADGDAVWGQWCDDAGPIAAADWPIARALRGEAVAPVDIYKRLPDGTRHYMQVSAAPLHDAAGQIIGSAATAIDITDRKRAEQRMRDFNVALEQRVAVRTAELEAAIQARDREAVDRERARELLARSEQLLSDVVNNSTAVIYLKDLDGRYLLINRHYERLFHVTNAEWVGRTDHELLPGPVADTLRANDRRVQESGLALHVEEVVPTAGRDRMYISVKFPLRRPDGAIYGVCGMSTDITERQEMEAALRRSESTLASILDSSNDPICALSRDWQLVAMNAAATSLIPDLIGSLPALNASLDFVSEDFAAQWRALFERGMAGERFTVERSLTIQAVTRDFLVSFNPTIQDGAVTGVAVFGREVTDLKRAEAEARHHQAELAHVLRLHTMGEMAASLAHEVNQPLGAIANYAQGCRNRLRAGNADAAQLLETVEAITREALRAGEITRRVRELLRKEEPPRAAVDAAEIVRAALEIIAAAAHRHQVALEARIEDGAMPVLADQIQVEQVVVNLVLNAFEATAACPEPRTVAVRVGRGRDHMVEIAVSDSGPGIDASAAPRIFDPFFTTKDGGLGMGLAISRSIVTAHGGRLWHSPNPGRGTTFHFTLPIAS